MLQSYNVITVIPVNDLENAEDFYGGVLGLKKVVGHPQGAQFASGTGAIAVVESVMAGSSQAVCAWWVVDDIEKIVKKLKRRGVVFEANNDLPYAIQKNDIYDLGGGLKAALFRDPDGNILGLGTI